MDVVHKESMQNLFLDVLVGIELDIQPFILTLP